MIINQDMLEEKNKKSSKNNSNNIKTLKSSLDLLASATLQLNKEWSFIDTTVDKNKSYKEIEALFTEISKIKPADYKNLKKFIEYNKQMKKIKNMDKKRMHSEYETRRRNIINLGINAMMDFFEVKTRRSKKEIITEAVKMILEMKIKELKQNQ
ncbi:hypothetical protein SLOPH_456 [Spraguea lophii 42_110]|uniref:BHLH domain-containing protein n=1 Tax=Spraguea lophii (strain 42_110) TaxID=1358809 RepID=S7WAE5_SPRLO|nr:hypothetical protein SLOPH_456 [Spraguea lophii 42_110]